METRPAYFRSTLHLLRRRHGASRFARCRTEKTRRPVQSQKVQRPGDLLRQPAREIRTGIDASRNDGFPAVELAHDGSEAVTPWTLGTTFFAVFAFARCSCSRFLGSSHL